jgi:hypothetical protein
VQDCHPHRFRHTFAVNFLLFTHCSVMQATRTRRWSSDTPASRRPIAQHACGTAPRRSRRRRRWIVEGYSYASS